jgi:CheY-like chemotaxis protein
MPDFRCDMLDERGVILFSAEIIAETQEGAIQHASDILRTSNQSLSSRRVYAFEVWSGTSRLFPAQQNAMVVPTGRSENRVKLIVVDDDQETRSLVAGFLVDAGYLVIQAADGAQALALLTDDRSLRMMISDIRMPAMSGIELAEEAVRRHPKLRVILISGFIDQPHTWPFLMKPFRRFRLCDLVAHAISWPMPPSPIP